MAVLIWTDGKSYDVPDDKVQQALADGFKQPTAADLLRDAAAQQPVQAGVESAARSFLPVVGQDLLTAFEEGLTGQSEAQVLEAQNLRKQTNPVASAIGSGAGFIAGPGKLLKPLTAPMRAAGLLGTAGAGALEGTAMGLSEAVNESIIENKPLVAEQLASSALASALTGAVVDFGFGAISKGTSALIKKAGVESVSDLLKSKGDDLSIGMIDNKSWARKYGAFEEDVARVAREEGVLTRATALDDASVQAAKEATERTGQKIGAHLEAAQYFDPPKHTEVTDAVLAKLKDMGLERDPLAQAALTDVQSTLEFMQAQKSTWQEYWNLQSSWRAANVGDTVKNDVFQVARKELRDVIMENAGRRFQQAQLKGAGPIPVDATLQALNKRYAALNAFESGLEEATLRYKSSHGPGLIGTVATAGAFTGGGVVPALGTLAANRIARQRGGFLLGETLHALGESDITKGLGESFRKNVLQRLAVAPELLGPFRATLEAAAARGADDLMETHHGLASSSVGPEYLTTMGMSPETPEQMQGMNQRLAAFDALKRAAAAQEIALASAADGVLGAAPGRKGAISVQPLSRKQYEKTMEGLQRVLQDGEGMYARIPPDLVGAAPETTGATAAALVNAARFLDSKAPKNPYAGMPPAVAPKWEPDAVSLDRFSRYKEAVESPARVLKNMANGYIAPEQVEALKAVYPAMYANLQQKISERLMMLKKPLSYQQRLAVTAIIGPGALGMSPQQVQVLQQSQALASGQNSGQGKPMKGPDGRQDVNEEQLQTEAQKLENR